MVEKRIIIVPEGLTDISDRPDLQLSVPKKDPRGNIQQRTEKVRQISRRTSSQTKIIQANEEVLQSLKEKRAREAAARAYSRSVASSRLTSLLPLSVGDGITASKLEAYNRWAQKQIQQDSALAAKLQLDSSKDWVRGVGSALAAGQIYTFKQYIRLVAAVHAQINQALLSRNLPVLRRARNNVILEMQYQLAREQFSKKRFRLYVSNDTIGGIPPLLRSQNRLRNYGRILKEQATDLVYQSLLQAIVQVCQKVEDDVAWPKEYTMLMLATARKNKAKLKIYGESLSTWRVVINFEDFFGDYKDLTEGMHSGALLAGAVENRSARMRGLVAGQGGSRVRLPYKGQKLKNRERVRYGFWSAMASGKLFYYGGYATKARAQKAKIAQYLRMREAEDRLMERQQERSSRLFQFGNKTASEQDLLIRAAQLEEDEEARDLASRRVRKAARQLENVRGVRIPPNLWEETVQIRVNYWQARGVAPMWLLLEYGQFEWRPFIMPQGFTYVFYELATQKIKALADMMWQKEMAAAGMYTDRRGSIRATGTPIHFGGYGGRTPQPGAFLPKSFLTAMDEHAEILRRNAEDALRVAGRFAKAAPRVPREWLQDESMPKHIARFWRNLEQISEPRESISLNLVPGTNWGRFESIWRSQETGLIESKFLTPPIVNKGG